MLFPAGDFHDSCNKLQIPASWPLNFPTKNTILKAYGGYFKAILQAMYEKEFKKAFDSRHGRLDSPMERRLCLGVQELRRRRAERHGGAGGRLARTTSVLLSPDDKTVESEAAHGTITRLNRQHQQGKETSTNPIDLIFAWTRGWSAGTVSTTHLTW